MSGSFLNKPIHRKKEKFQNRTFNHNQNPIVSMCKCAKLNKEGRGKCA
jgi:hypothetical protein